MSTARHKADSAKMEYALESALDPGKFPSKGYFFHAGVRPNAPNPCINLPGYGILGLPLNQLDVLPILSNTSPSVVGQSTSDMPPPNLWEWVGSSVSFGNPLWHGWLEGVCKEVSARFGLSKEEGRKSQLRFLKLQVSGAGGCAHWGGTAEYTGQPTEKPIGTVIVLLPSEYSGGQIDVSHSKTTRTVDLSAKSSFAAAIFASYNDVEVRMQPVTSGYRLALLYDLVSPCRDLVLPSLPDHTQAYDEISAILHNWQKSKNSDNYLIYLLQRHYDKELSDGEWCLRDADRQRVAIIRDVADGLGLVVRLATVEHYEIGTGDAGDFDPPYRGERVGQDEDENDHDLPQMNGGEIDDFKTTELHGVFDLDGNACSTTGGITLEEKDCIPSDSIEAMELTRWEFDRNGPTMNLHMYSSRTAIIIIQKEYSDQFHWNVGEIAYAVKKLEHANLPLSADDMLWVNRIVKYLSDTSHPLYSERDPDEDQVQNPEKRDYAMEVLGLALKWKDATTWNGLINTRAYSFERLAAGDLVQAWKTFGFDLIKPGLEQLAMQGQTIESLKSIHLLPKHASEGERDAVIAWCQGLKKKVVASFKPRSDNLNTILEVLQEAGFTLFEICVMPKVTAPIAEKNFALELAKILRENKQDIIKCQAQLLAQPPLVSSSPNASVTEERAIHIPTAEHFAGAGQAVEEIIIQCLASAASNWYVPTPVTAEPHYNYYPRRVPRPIEMAPKPETAAVGRFTRTLDEAILGSHYGVCKALCNAILERPGPSRDNFAVLYRPLISRLLDLLKERGQDLFAPPFLEFFQKFISLYLRDILGSKSDVSNYRLRKLGCGCKQCKPLDAFALNPAEADFSVRAKREVRDHLEEVLKYASDFCIWTTDTRKTPYTLRIMKRPEIVRLSTWEGRVLEAADFLADIGSGDVVKKIMGPHYADLPDALARRLPFGNADLYRKAATTDDMVSHTLLSAGRKRKLGEVDSEF